MLLMNFSIHKECDQNCVINKKHSMKILFCLLYCIFAPGETLDRRKAQNPQNPQRGSQHVGIDCLAEQNQYLFSCCHVSSPLLGASEFRRAPQLHCNVPKGDSVFAEDAYFSLEPFDTCFPNGLCKSSGSTSCSTQYVVFKNVCLETC